MRIRGVVFDMDGLMLDTESVYMKAWDWAGERMGVGPAGYMAIKALGMNVEQARPIWLGEFGQDFDYAELRRLTGVFMRDYYAVNTAPVKPGLHELLDCLDDMGCPAAVASSSVRRDIEKHLGGAGVLHRFRAIVSGDIVRRAKPDPEPYITACALLGAPPKECMALDDSRNGLLSACRAGCITVMVPDLWQPDDEMRAMVHAVFPSLHDVRAMLTSETLR